MSRPRTPDLDLDFDLDLPTPPPGPVTWEEFLAWYGAGENVRAEWVDGVIEVMLPVSYEHQNINLFLAELINPFVQAHGLGEIILPLPMRLPGRRRGRLPDLLFVATEHRDRIRPTYLAGPADLAVEIVSPDSIKRDAETKLAEYAAGGVREYWHIDPLTRQAAFYQLQPDGSYQPGAIDPDGIYHSVVIPGFWLRVAWLWQRPLPPMATIRREFGLS